MYFSKVLTTDARMIHSACARLTSINKLLLASMFSGLAAFFQAAGAVFPGIGYMISPLATAPIILCSIISIRFGLLSYLATIFLLFMSHPSELVIFPFTTGFLGLAIGLSFLIFSKRFSVIFAGSSALSLGIVIVLYGLQFPLLGPVISTSMNLVTVGGILLFSSIYSWVWVEIFVACLKRVRRIISQ